MKAKKRTLKKPKPKQKLIPKRPKLKQKLIPNKPKPKQKLTPSVPSALAHGDIHEMLSAYDEAPSVFWDTVADTWDWSALRKGGKLAEHVQQLDRHFVAQSKTHNVCPIVLLLNCGEKDQ